MYDIFPIDSKDLLPEQVPFLYSDHGGDLPSFACMTDQRLLTELTVLNSDKENPQEDGGLITNPNSLYGYDFGLFEDSVCLQVGEETKHEILSGIFDFPIDAELHEVLGAAFLNGADNNMSGIPLFGDNESENAGAACVNETTEFVEPSFGGSFGWFSESDHLDAAIANFYGNGSPTDSSGNLEASCLTNSKSEGGLFGDDSLPNFIPREHFIGSQTKCVSDLFNEEQKITKEPRYGRCGKRTNSSNMNGKRGRLSGVHKPRPRDRQLIQDCVKELRMLVPDGAKCSIDSLLGRTVKHLTFLRDVSNQAKKMKQYADLKVGNEDHKTTGVQNHHQNGMSWAYEIGSRPSTCPIVVENLNQPGHMLVEMLCKEPELFLDIAQLIKRTGLTILKGVMEPRSDNTWARFIVEASRGFHRMEILWPLMQLLQRNGNPISGGVNYH
ncbi:Transcription factor LHW [Acorus calamus]|uniref:Transcription factor LHW n=1 Tax=Acorus calamus TaxID=4465 RepID=A0AAV9DCY4_ACOCL|nr:Transcription factor LHW [Acorus calamus]